VLDPQDLVEELRLVHDLASGQLRDDLIDQGGQTL
jgi:hypothetical protein